MAQTDNHLVIMAGGVGSRFWPMSTADRPKQFIDVLGVGKTLIQLTNERFSGVIPPCNVWVVTNEKYVSVVQEQLPDIPVDHILSEPCRRNTAPCIAYVSWRIKKENPKANIVVSPSDHIVTNPEEFRRVVTNCLKFTAETDAIVTLGMKPTRPETGYGYIQADLATAIQYTKQSNFFWNAGIFIWSASTIVNAFRIYQPGVARIFENIMDILGTADEQRVIDEVYPECDNISVDYAIMEKAEEIFVCPADFGWSDLGTWGSLLAQTPHDLYGNAIIGENIQLFDSKNCIIHTTEERKVVVQGLDGYIVAEKDDTLLICKLSEEQRIKQFSGE